MLWGSNLKKKFLMFVKCPRDLGRKSDWFRCQKISQKLIYLNFKCEQKERYFFFLPISTLRMSHAKHIAGDKQKF